MHCNSLNILATGSTELTLAFGVKEQTGRHLGARDYMPPRTSDPNTAFSRSGTLLKKRLPD